MPPSPTPKSPAPSASSPKSSSHYILIALSLIIVAGFIVMYFKMDLLSKNLNTVAKQAEQKTPPPAPAPQATQPPVVQTPPKQSTITEVYTDPTTGLIFAVPNSYRPENYTFKKESVAGTELVSKISVKRTEDGMIPACASWFTVSSAGGPIDPDGVLLTSKYAVSAPAADCEVIVKEKTVWKTYTSENFQFDYPNTLTPMEERGATVFVDATYGKASASNPTAFSLSCPIPDTGLEAWNFTTQKRSFTKNGKTNTVELWLGTPIPGGSDYADPKTNDLNVILMYQGDNLPNKGCSITSGNDTTDSLYQGIYESIK